MNRFFRSAFFPLIVIVLLVWLASQTLIPKNKNVETLKTSQAITLVQTGKVKDALFNPSKRAITFVDTTNGKKANVHYASEQAQQQ